MFYHQSVVETLKKISITAVYFLTDGSEDPFTLEENLEYASRIRVPVGAVQVMGFHRSNSGGFDLVLRFSPMYLHQNYHEFPGLDASYEWIFSLPKYTIIDCVDEDGNDRCDEIGVIEWLTQGTVKIEEDNIKKVHWSGDEFQTSIDQMF